MARNADFFYRGLAGYLAQRTAVTIEPVESVPWQEREQMLDRGEAQIGFICGLPYVRKVDRPNPSLELLAAPVMQGDRYQGRPIYYSDVVVHRDSSFRCFADLRGAAWAYNEPGSQSGYNLVRSHLARLGAAAGYFGRIVEAGAHQVSLRLIIEGAVDAAAIDSAVLELELKLHPELKSHLRVIQTLGPSAVPPAVVSRRVPAALRRRLREALLSMHESMEGRRLLDEALMERYVEIADADYNGIRRMAREAESVSLGREQSEYPPPSLARSEGAAGGAGSKRPARLNRAGLATLD